MAADLDTQTAADTWTSTVVDPETGGMTTEPVVAEPEPAPVAGDVPAEPAQAAATQAERERNEHGQFTSEKQKSKRHDPAARVKDATAEAARERDARAAAEKKASDLEQRLAALEQAKQVPKVEPAAADAPAKETRPKPTIASLIAAGVEDPYEALADAVYDWREEQRAAKSQDDIEAKVAAHFERVQQAERSRQTADAIQTRGRATYSDYDAKVGACDVHFPHGQVLAQAFAATPEPEHVFYALANDRALAERIAGIDNLFQLGVEFAKFSPSSGAVARPDSASTAPVSSAKPPINRVGGTANAVPVDPDDLPFGPDYIRAENEREKKRAQANRW